MFAGENLTTIDTIGQRILQAARLAVATHMQQVAETAAAAGSKNNARGQRVVIGRAGPHAGVGVRLADRSKDGRLPTSDGELASAATTFAAGPETEDDVSDSPAFPSSAEGAD